jgi:hypothetical protein
MDHNLNKTLIHLKHFDMGNMYLYGDSKDKMCLVFLGTTCFTKMISFSRDSVSAKNTSSLSSKIIV